MVILLKKQMRLVMYAKSLVKKETPWYIKAVAGLSLVYAFVPLDVLPDFLGLVGIVDDAAVMGILTTAGISLLNNYYDRNPQLVPVTDK